MPYDYRDRSAHPETWAEWDSAAEYHAKHGRLPDGLSGGAHELISEDPDVFMSKVSAYKYALTMEEPP